MVDPENGALFDLSARTKLRVTGADALRYLNGQISNDARQASATAAIHACVLSVKGKISADVFIRRDGDAFLLESEAEPEQLIARLERYAIADDVQFEDVTNDFALFHLLGGSELSDVSLVADRFGFPGRDLWLPASEHEAAAKRLGMLAPLMQADSAETFRIERGLPRWGHELTEEIIPTEANLESSAIDYAKGCYIGQEVISRIKMSGQTNKRLGGLVAETDAPLVAGMRLWATDDSAKEAGWVTSVTTSARLGQRLALAFLKRGHQEIGTTLVARAANDPKTEATVRIAALPFA